MKFIPRFSSLNASKIFLSLAAFAATGVRSAQDDQRIPKAAAWRFRVVWVNDASTQASILWNAVSSGARKIYYGEQDYGQEVSKYPMSMVPLAPVAYRGLNTVVARLNSLKPDTVYYWVVDEGGTLSPRYWFRSAPANSTKRLSFVAGGDSRNNRVPRQNANLLVAKLRPTAVLFGGDYTASGTDTEWRDWMDDWQKTIASDGRVTPIVPTRGNHENSNEIISKLFDAPDSNYYGVNIGGDLLRVYTLNTESSVAGNQTNWLQRDLNENAGARWKFAQYHRPMRPHTRSKSEGVEQYRSWAQLFYDKGMDLVIESDTHLIKATWPVRPGTGTGSSEGFRRDDETGTVYIGEGGWGAPLRSVNDNKEWTRDSGAFNHFHWVFVGRDKIEVRAIDTANASDVSSVTDRDPFATPSKLKIWSPPNGPVIEIRRPTR